MKNNFVAIVLAAGIGKRMKSKLSKVLHSIGSKPMLLRTLEILNKVRPYEIIIVVNPKNLAPVRRVVGKNYTFAIQKSPLGTADATKAGLKVIHNQVKDIAVLYGDDTAFYSPETISDVFENHQKSEAVITFVTLEKEDPTGLGRILRGENGKLIGIIEEKDATEVQRKINEVNDGLYFFNKKWLVDNLARIKASPISGEFYVTDLIALAQDQGVKVQTYKLKDSAQWHGINTLEELAAANRKLVGKIHIMGIAGAGASAVAGITRAYGFEVSGCDLFSNSPYSKNIGMTVLTGHNPSHLDGVNMLVISPAVEKLNPNNPELIAARDRLMPVLTWQEFQGQYLQAGKYVIAVAGAYGKSTTCAMISQILIDQNMDPTCQIGAKVLAWKANFRVGKSKYYVCEADEYNNNFLNYQPDIAVILNTAWDHPDYFKTKQSVISSYKKFVGNIKSDGFLILGSDPETSQLAKAVKISKERSDPKQIKIMGIGNYGRFNLAIIGKFRVQNANAALTVAKVLGLDLRKAKKSIENFKGVGRRLEYKGEIGGVKIYDDYAVQPYTVLTTANALKDKFPNKKICLVFEPHTFSRIKAFFENFVKNLKNTKVDRVFITSVYAAREHGDKTKLAIRLAKSVGEKAQYTGSLEDTASLLKEGLGSFDIVCSMGAGDVYKLYDLLKGELGV